MIKKTHKRAVFLLGVVFSSCLGAVGGYVGDHFTESGSFIFEKAYADLPPPAPVDAPAVDYNLMFLELGSGGGGCSGSDSCSDCSDSGGAL